MTARSLVAVAGLIASGSAAAHTGLGLGDGFTAGFMHPVLGLDHLLAAVAVGLWAARHEGREIWVLPIAFLLAMVAGVGLGVAGVGLPGVEPVILISLLVFGGALALPQRAPLALAGPLLTTFALFHGHAHGTEVPPAAALATYGPGLLFATGLLHAVGVVAGRQARPWALRLVGAAIGGTGLLLFAT